MDLMGEKKGGVDHLLKSIQYLANMVFMQDGTPRDKNAKLPPESMGD